jgi:hypothetical protein
MGRWGPGRAHAYFPHEGVEMVPVYDRSGKQNTAAVLKFARRRSWAS